MPEKKEGYDAFYNRKDISDNPYDVGSLEWGIWKKGWKEAKEEDDDYYDDD